MASLETTLLPLLVRIRRRAEALVRPDAPTSATRSDGEEPTAAWLAARPELRLTRLVQRLALSPLAVDALVCLLAAEYDPFLRHAQRALQADRGHPWLELGTLSELIGLPLEAMPELARRFAPDGELRRWALVDVDERASAPAPFRRAKIVDRVAEYLVGIDAWPRSTTLMTPHVCLAESLVPAAMATNAMQQVRAGLSAQQPLVVAIAGVPGGGRRFFAAAVAAELGRPLLTIDLAVLDRAAVGEAWSAGQRDARLHDALLCFANWDAHMSSPAPSLEPTTAPRQLPDGMTPFLRQLDQVVLLTAEEREPLVEQQAPATVRVDVPFPTPSQRAAFLRAAVAATGVTLAAGVDVEAIARRFALAPARLAAAAATATRLADGTVSAALLRDACARQLRHDLKSVAVRVLNNHRRDDMVVSDDVREAVDEMIAYVHHAGHVYDEWGFGARHSLTQGISALFSGPPGTGKTMCASVIAHELDMELFRVDLASVVSKWVGETEKNLAHVFDEAQRSSAIILFDEADSLFGKRTEVSSANDRYANLEVNFLLQRMEAFGGISILTTNHENAIDPAFVRRLTFRVRFERPSPDERATLWRTMFPSRARLADDVDVALLGRLYKLSGGSIRNAAVRAAFLAAASARPIDMRSCKEAAERECIETGQLVQSSAADA